MNKYGLILAAGKGTRMKSNRHKVLHEILGKPMINYVYDNMTAAGVENVYPILGYQKEEVLKVIPGEVEWALQAEQLGTGHAVMQAEELLKDKDGITVIMVGDQPLISSDSLNKLFEYHESNENDLTLLTAVVDTPHGYGRIIRDGDEVLKIVEQKDCTKEEANTKEINISTYCFDNKKLFNYIHEIDNNNANEEYYITDLIEIFRSKGLKVGAVSIDDNEESTGINDKYVLSQVSRYMQRKINKMHMLNGVEMIDPDSTYIGPDVTIGSDTIIYPNTVILGESSLGSNNIIKSSYIIDSSVGNNITLGPFAHLRGHAVIEDDVRIGNFVEVKKSLLKKGAKAAHLSYMGDSEIGQNVNMGCGSITVNYDGANKHKTIIEDNVFVGCNVNLIAPVTVGEGSLLAAGSTIHDNVPSDSLAIARNKQTVKDGYYKKKK